jgi:hypothetical protein
LYVSDQVSRHRETPFYHPGGRNGLAGRSDLISEIDDQSGSSG